MIAPTPGDLQPRHFLRTQLGVETTTSSGARHDLDPIGESGWHTDRHGKRFPPGHLGGKTEGKRRAVSRGADAVVQPGDLPDDVGGRWRCHAKDGMGPPPVQPTADTPQRPAGVQVGEGLINRVGVPKILKVFWTPETVATSIDASTDGWRYSCLQ